jgi:hypothetical protein
MIEKFSEAFYRLDLYSTNPAWRTNTSYFSSTWKSIIATLLIISASLGLTYDQMQMFWMDPSDLPVLNQFY